MAAIRLEKEENVQELQALANSIVGLYHPMHSQISPWLTQHSATRVLLLHQEKTASCRVSYARAASKPKLYRATACMPIGTCWTDMHHATSPESLKAALQALRAEVEQLQAEKRESEGDATRAKQAGIQTNAAKMRSESISGDLQRFGRRLRRWRLRLVGEACALV